MSAKSAAPCTIHLHFQEGKVQAGEQRVNFHSRHNELLHTNEK